MSTTTEDSSLSVAAAMMVDVLPDLSTIGPLIGRSDELDQLSRMVGIDRDGTAIARRPGAVLLSGDAGVGKSRLLTELRKLVDGTEWRVLVGHCLDFGATALPYLPFGEAFARLDATAPALADTIAQEHPAIGRLLPGRRQPDRAEGGDGLSADRTELFEAVHAALDQLGEQTPTLLVVEDVHWADQSTRELLSFLFAREFTHPVAVVASYRSDELHRRHPLRTTVAAWTRLPGVARLDLAPLPDSDVRTLVRSLHPAPLREGDVQAVVERAEGNAFFAEELVAATRLGQGTLPKDLADLLLVRLDQLDESAKLVLRVASVSGRWVSHELLSRVVELDTAALDRALRAAVEANVLVTVDHDGYTFRHALLGEAVYEDLLPGERVRLHASYVTAMCAEDSGASAAEIARHARAAHDHPTAIAASVRAGDEAMSVTGFEEAAQHYEVALELLQEPRPDDATAVDVVELTIKASEATAAAGRPHRALGIVQDQLARPVERPSIDRARLLYAFAQAALLYESNVDALAATTEALRLVPPEPPTELRARLLGVHAFANSDRQRYDDAIRWGNEARELGRRLQLPDVVADATTTLAKLKLRTGDPEASERALEQVAEEARAQGDGTAEVRAVHHLGGLYLEQGQLTDALRVLRQGADRARAIGRPWAPYGLDSRLLAGIAAYQAGDWEQALEIADVSGQDPPSVAEAGLAAVGMAVAAGRGESSAVQLLPHTRGVWERDGVIAIWCGAAAIDLYGDRGELSAALAVHDDVVTTVGGMWQCADFQARVRLAGLVLGQLCAAAARSSTEERTALTARAAQLANLVDSALTRVDRQFGRRGLELLAWVARAHAEQLRLRWLTGVDAPSEDELVSAWREAVAGFERYPNVFELARTQTRLAAVLRASGDVVGARPHLDAARATAHRLGAEPLLAEQRALGATGSARADRTTPLDQSLTPREAEILALVAQGRSNREIGTQLYISAKTVSVHVSNILAKLGAAGRTEAVAVARRRGLITD